MAKKILRRTLINAFNDASQQGSPLMIFFNLTKPREVQRFTIILAELFSTFPRYLVTNDVVHKLCE